MSQKQAVIAILDAGIAAGLTGTDLRKDCIGKIKEGLMQGQIPHSKGQLDDKSATTYAGALVSNYLKKEATYHNGVPYSERKTERGPRVKDAELMELNKSIESLEAQPNLSDEHKDLLARAKVARDNRKTFLDSQKATKDVMPLEDAVASINARLQAS